MGVASGVVVDPVSVEPVTAEVVGVVVDVGEVEDDEESDPALLGEDADAAGVDEAPAPEKLDEPEEVKAVVVVPTGLVKAFDPPHPVMEKVAITNPAIVHKP